MSFSPYVIAEIASAHEGDARLALDLFGKAAASGAAAVKFQIFNRDALMSAYHPKFEAFGIIEIAPAAWRDILSEAGRADVDVLAEVFDEPSLALAEDAGTVAGYKIPNSDIGNLAFVARVGATGKQVYLSVGGAELDEIDRAVERLEGVCVHPPVLMLGFQAVPTALADSYLSRIAVLRERYRLPVGYADHVDAEDREPARTLPAMAMAAGCVVIEKHITPDRAAKGRDHVSALDPDEFKSFVGLMNTLAAAMGSPDFALSAAEVEYRRMMKRQAVAARRLEPGAQLAADDVVFKRTGTGGLSPAEITEFVGRTLTDERQPDEPLRREDFA